MRSWERCWKPYRRSCHDQKGREAEYDGIYASKSSWPSWCRDKVHHGRLRRRVKEEGVNSGAYGKRTPTSQRARRCTYRLQHFLVYKIALNTYARHCCIVNVVQQLRPAVMVAFTPMRTCSEARRQKAKKYSPPFGTTQFVDSRNAAPVSSGCSLVRMERTRTPSTPLCPTMGSKHGRKGSLSMGKVTLFA